ncbi:MAG: LLM class F420-dependent oxidoreductase [Gammaproteobacteria bacterium]|nr:LLM class F420-dependent oxidoreductase [Gammaproteobacteria bacterium]MBI5617133.1 LLM class F420-dependent oxidoreductase [Gammaproteobacteria bacterium]
MDVGFVTIASAQSGDLVAVAQQAEALGFDSLWIPEHPVIPRGEITPYPFGGPLPEHYGRWLDPFVALTVCATVTTKLKLATGICLLPEREPLMTAKVIASLDFVSRGRVLLGIGAGWLKEETEVMGANFATRWQRMREMAEALRVLWTEESPSYQGKQISFPPVRCEPKPVQAGGPPFLLGGHGEKGLMRIAKNYDGWCPLANDPTAFAAEAELLREMTREAGRDPSKIELTPFVDPQAGELSTAALRAYRDAGCTRIVVFPHDATPEIADGKALEWMARTANIVERARTL